MVKPVNGRKKRLMALLIVCVIETVCLGSPPLAGSFGGEAAHLEDLFQREWEFRLREDPLLATAVGRHEYDDLLPRVDAGHQGKRAAVWKKFLHELDTIPRHRLSETDAVSADIFRRQLEDTIAEIRFGAFQIPLNADSGFQTDFARLPDEMPFDTVEDYSNYAARLMAFPSYVDQQTANMRQGMVRGMTLPAAVTAGLDAGIAAQIVEDPEKSGFFQPYLAFPPGVPVRERDRLREQGRRAVLEGAVAGYRRFLGFLTGEYLPACRKSVAAADLPDGRAYYQQQIRRFTTLDLSPAEIHAVGEREVKRIHGEMMKIIRDLEFDGSFADFLHDLRTNPRFYAHSADELLKEAAYIAQ
ncbi:MAG: DUF885 family protein, partial [Acidobacteriota bacterium]